MLKAVKKENGQAMVEFALVLPILLLVVCGIIDFGWLFFNHLTLQNASNIACRAAVVDWDDCGQNNSVFGKDIEDVMLKNLINGMDDHLVLDHEFINQSGSRIQPVGEYPLEGNLKLTAKTKVKLLTPIISTIIRKSEWDMEVKVVMKMES